MSGAARGIDAASHRGALYAGGTTIAVLGSGHDLPYPKGSTELVARVAASGAVVSEYAPGVVAEPFRFPARNRLVAALGRALVVVEGAHGSGSMISVDHALDLGRDIFAVPGPVTNPLAEVPLALIREGATMIRGPTTCSTTSDTRSGSRSSRPRPCSATSGRSTRPSEARGSPTRSRPRPGCRSHRDHAPAHARTERSRANGRWALRTQGPREHEHRPVGTERVHPGSLHPGSLQAHRAVDRQGLPVAPPEPTGSSRVERTMCTPTTSFPRPRQA